MQRNEILKKVQIIFQDIFDDDTLKISEGTSAVDIEAWDSLTHINILAAIQDEFSVSFSMSEIAEMKSVGDIISEIQKKIK